MPKFDFSNEEVKMLKGFLDVAVKALGIQVASNALMLLKKLNNPSLREKQKEKDGEEEKKPDDK